MVEPDRAADRDAVAVLLGHEPRGAFEVVVRDAVRGSVVIRNAPLLDDGTPMPTLYWLVGSAEREAVSRLESAGGVRWAEEQVDPHELAEAHARYATERSAEVPQGHPGPLPAGGVGGTRRGVKCLHAHLAWFLAGGDDPVGRLVAAKLAGERVAAVDCGSNSTRLLVAATWPFAAADSPPLTLVREMRITTLGEGVDANRALSPAAIERTLAVLAGYRSLIDGLGPVTADRAVATSAVRDASNGGEFLQGAGAVLGFAPEILTGEEEGRLSFAGATAGLCAVDGGHLVLDVGGGSTELIAGTPGGKVDTAISLDVGCVRVTERYLAGDPPAPGQIAAARHAVASLVDEAVASQPALASRGALIGLAGTVSALAMLDRGLERYDRNEIHHHVLRREVVERLLAELAAMSALDRRGRRGLEPGRADVIVGGAAVLAEVMDRLGFDELTVSESDILDGIVSGLVADLAARRA